MIISVINNTDKDDLEFQEKIRAINLQIARDFEPYWSLSGRLRLEGNSSKYKINYKTHPVDMRGDAIIYVWEDPKDMDTAIGFHNQSFRGIPHGYVFTKLSKKLQEDWSVALSHEALEIIVNPAANLLVSGPHPDPEQKGRTVLHTFEMCDVVQGESYEIENVEVSNFVLPLYFTPGEEHNGRNDFLGRSKNNEVLKSFGVKTGGYSNFYDIGTKTWSYYILPDDTNAEERRQIKNNYFDLSNYGDGSNGHGNSETGIKMEPVRRISRYKENLK